MDQISVVIPIYKLVGSRLNNLEFVLTHISKLGCNIIVCEQRSESTSADILSKFDVHHVIENINSTDTIHKSKLINKASTYVDSKYMWMVDADFFTNYNVVLQYTHTHEYDLIRPFSSVLFLNEAESTQLISSGGVTLNGNYSTNNQTGKFSFIINYDLFMSVGGMNENFIGWGYQDLDFVENRLPKTTTIGAVDQFGYHLYHKRASQKYADANYKLYSHTRKTKKLTPQQDSTIEYLGRNFT